MTVYCWGQAIQYISKLPDTPEPFSWKAYVGDAFSAGYEAAMKDGLQKMEDHLQQLKIARQYEAEDENKVEKLLYDIINLLEQRKEK